VSVSRDESQTEAHAPGTGRQALPEADLGAGPATGAPLVYEDHPLSAELIDADAIKIVQRLQRYGYEAYLVGGCVRDAVLEVPPKDYDIATSATPRQIKKLFRNCRVIGRRFRLCHIFFKDKIIEVATFRADPLAKLEEDRPEAAAAQADALEARDARLAAAKRGSAEPPAPPGETGETGAGSAGAPAQAPAAAETAGAVPGSGLMAHELSSFQAGLVEDDELAPWERDEESAAREEEAVKGRKARAREELAESVDDDPDRSERRRRRLRRRTREEAPSSEVETGSERAKQAEPDAGKRKRRRRRWEQLLDEPPPQGYGDASEDARLRDFTVNALFYDPVSDQVIDYVGGWEDLHARVLRTIGDPDERLREDPVRILRAVKGATRGGLRIEPLTRQAMVRQREGLKECSPRRLLEEILKLLASGASADAFRQMGALGITRVFLPEVAHVYDAPGAQGLPYLEALDRATPASLDPALLIAALFYPAICRGWEVGGLGRPGALPEYGGPRRYNEGAAEALADDVLRAFARDRSLSRRARSIATRILLAQRLMRRPREMRRRSARLVARDWFDDALRLLRITVDAEGADDEVVAWWESRAAAVREGGGLEELAEEDDEEKRPRRRRRQAGRRGRRGGRSRRRRGKRTGEGGERAAGSDAGGGDG
jgi:tRNA nucleotidyltransferase/poly(A) polymerase